MCGRLSEFSLISKEQRPPKQGRESAERTAFRGRIESTRGCRKAGGDPLTGTTASQPNHRVVKPRLCCLCPRAAKGLAPATSVGKPFGTQGVIDAPVGAPSPLKGDAAIAHSAVIWPRMGHDNSTAAPAFERPLATGRRAIVGFTAGGATAGEASSAPGTDEEVT